jgi:hypothetical protein
MRLFRRRGERCDEYGDEIPVPALPARPADRAQLPPVGPVEIDVVELPSASPGSTDLVVGQPGAGTGAA